MKQFLTFMRCYLYFQKLGGFQEHLLWDKKVQRYWVLNQTDATYNEFEVVLN